MKTFIVKVLMPVAILAFVIAFAGFFGSEVIKSETIVIPVMDFQIDRSYQAVARGGDLYITRRCAQCHGANGDGKTFFSDKWMGTISGPNLTSGEGGVASKYKFGQDWDRAIRYGLNSEAHPIMFMPSDVYSKLSDQDLHALIAYLMSLPPVDRKMPKANPGLWPRALFIVGLFPMLLPYEMVDPAKPHIADIPIGITNEYGQYIAQDCVSCHGSELKGGFVPGMRPKWPKAANLGTGGVMSKYTAESFKNFLRSGVTATGRQVDATYMPWDATARLRDVEIDALYLFLKSRG